MQLYVQSITIRIEFLPYLTYVPMLTNIVDVFPMDALVSDDSWLSVNEKCEMRFKLM